MLIDGFTLFGSWPGLPYDHPIEHLVDGLQRHKLDRACTLSTKGIYFDAAAGNQATWAACQQDARLTPIGVIDPRVSAEAQVVYCRDKGFPVMAMFPNTQGWAVSAITAQQALIQVAEAKLPLMIEAGEAGDASAILAATRELSMPVVLLDVSLATLCEVSAVLGARPDTYVSTRLLCGADTLESLVRSVGSQRLIFASRFPISCFSSAFLTAKFADIGAADRDAIMGGNMARILE